jgi:transcriptional regulator with XRE-family HTH domain
MSKPLGKRIEDFRLDKEMTIREVAAFLGIGTGTVVRILRGEKCTKLTRAKIERRLDKVQTVAA